MRTVGIGIQDFEKIRRNNNFYVDKTDFIRQWWESNDDVTLITRPRRFGKTLTMDMVDKFFSIRYQGRSELFEGLAIWSDEKYRAMQGTYPVIFLSFAAVKETTFEGTRKSINRTLKDCYGHYDYLLNSAALSIDDKLYFKKVQDDMDSSTAAAALNRLCLFLYKHHGQKPLLLLDEYDTPMQEAWVSGYWDELTGFIRALFNSTFKTNPYLGRGLMTGITRVSKESVFSDLNNLKVVTTTSLQYTESFGFTENEVFDALDEQDLSDKKQQVKDWYDGFTFGNTRDIYNPWSVINFLREKRVDTYWANTSSNGLISKLIREGSTEIKLDFEKLLQGGTLDKIIDEQIIYAQLGTNELAIWSLLLASGYLTVDKTEFIERSGKIRYWMKLTNKEVLFMFERLVNDWFANSTSNYNSFIKALFRNDLEEMNAYMNRVAAETFSFFDSGSHPSEKTEPERFYHGFVLGLLVELRERYVLTSNRESGFGRYDVMLEPLSKQDNAFILEFKVQDPAKEVTLSDTVKSALNQIESKNYAAALTARGILPEKIHKYGFAFCGKQVLIGE